MKLSLSGATDPAEEQWAEFGSGADTWLQSLKSDLVAASGVRVIVPIADLGGHRSKYAAVIGVRATLAGYSYIRGMDVASFSRSVSARVASHGTVPGGGVEFHAVRSGQERRGH